MIHPRDIAHVSRDRRPVDFTRSLPPHISMLDSHLSAALAELSNGRNPGLLMRQSVARGSEEDRAAGAELLRARFSQPLDPSRIIVTNGTQNALLMLLRTLVGSGGLLLAERISYAALRALARLADVRLQGLGIDEDGIVPDAFEAACKKLRPKALYCNPTVHNPTTSIMPESRRLAIVDIARKYDVAIIEDDALGRLHPDAPESIAALAPDIAWYVMTMTKCMTQGLRIAYLVTPNLPIAQRRLASVEHLSCWHASPLSAAIVNLWVANGAAAEISNFIAQECIARERLAREILADLDIQSTHGSMHVWVGLPTRLQRTELVSVAERQGVLLRPSDVFSVDDQPTPNAVRLSLSPPADLDEVRSGLLIVRDVIEAAL